MALKAVPYPPPNHPVGDGPLIIHRLIVLLLWICALAISAYVLSRTESLNSVIALLSSAAIIATLGSAICTASSAFERDLLERVKLDMDIFFVDIAEQEHRWRRWPFLRRTERVKLLNGDRQDSKLYNPKVKLDVGTHIIEVDLPTVFEDFFDLPVVQNAWRLLWYKNASRTTLMSRNKELQSAQTGFFPSDERMAYACILDIWVSILKLRLCRLAVHFGVALTFCAVVWVALAVPRVSG